LSQWNLGSDRSLLLIGWPDSNKSQSENQLSSFCHSRLLAGLLSREIVQHSPKAMTGERITDGPRSRLTEVFHKISWSQDNETMTNGGVIAEKKAAQSEYLLGPSNGVGESCQTASINHELQLS
jgi:hypothetical protein